MHRRRSSPPRAAQKHKNKALHADKGPALRGYVPPAHPAFVVAEVAEVGASLVARVLHKELADIPFRLDIPRGFEVRAGDFVRATPHPQQRQLLQVEGLIPRSKAAIYAAIGTHGLREDFPPEALADAAAFPAFTWPDSDRTDWRDAPFITIDGEDARDFDDAVWAEPHADGWRVRVAIADVAHYVGPAQPLDHEAILRGNSTYFPTHVLPMLPERLSNDLCSLRPDVLRPVLGVEFHLGRDGQLGGYAFHRAAIMSRARMTYTAVQAFFDHGHGIHTSAVLDSLRALNEAFGALLRARQARGALDLELPETNLEVDHTGAVAGIGLRERLAAHQLIEELMIAANVCAATALSSGATNTLMRSAKGKGVAGLYRIHLPPSKEKAENLRAALGPLGFTPPPPNASPAAWAALARRVRTHDAAPTLQRAILQAQMQARYSPDNEGHFGLALPLYTHFTSPIRRYADLVVHRALLTLMRRESAALPDTDALARVAGTINIGERRSQMAEWDAKDRMVADFLRARTGETFAATVVNVAPFGCFVSLDGIAEALLPKWHLEDWTYVGGLNCFRRTRHGKGTLRVGSRLPVRLIQADFASGKLTVTPADAPDDMAHPHGAPHRPRRPHPARTRRRAP